MRRPSLPKPLRPNGDDYIIAELVAEYAPEQFSEAKDNAMIYKLIIGGEEVTSTDELPPKLIAKELKMLSKYLNKVAKFLESRKYDGQRTD
jgi:hypothetical protein